MLTDAIAGFRRTWTISSKLYRTPTNPSDQQRHYKRSILKQPEPTTRDPSVPLGQLAAWPIINASPTTATRTESSQEAVGHEAGPRGTSQEEEFKRFCRGLAEKNPKRRADASQ